jgi:hypothetical protein
MTEKETASPQSVLLAKSKSSINRASMIKAFIRLVREKTNIRPRREEY